jgi:hypothetical protein
MGKDVEQLFDFSAVFERFGRGGGHILSSKTRVTIKSQLF